MTENTYENNRALFPRGLRQPEGSFRFSMDALLLAAFIERHCLPRVSPPRTMLELGCGCGVVSLACLLADSGLTAVGADIVPELTAAAEDNAFGLGLDARFSAITLDLRESGRVRDRLAASSFGLIAANPPYHQLGHGREPRSVIRKTALFADKDTLPAFMRCARHALGPGGLYALIYPWDGLGRVREAFMAEGFSVTSLLPVCTVGNEPSRVLLAAAPTLDSGEPAPLPPLILHKESTGAYTAEAIRFCRWLNAGKKI